MILIVLFCLFEQIFGVLYNFTEYTHVARAYDGTPCLTGCSIGNECVINWDWEKRPCRTFEVSPIFLTSRKRDPLRRYCLSDCGFFGEEFEWCITTEDLKWDYCSSYRSKATLPSGLPVPQTRLGQPCNDECRWSDEFKYYWCNVLDDKDEQGWEYCSPPAQPRIPVLRDTYSIGKKEKGNCDGFLNYVSSFPYCSKASDAADDFVVNLADAIEGSTVVQNELTKVSTVTDAKSPITNYAMVRVGNFFVPIVIRARITNLTSFVGNKKCISEEVRQKIREQMASNTTSYEEGLLIGRQLGGPVEEYNIVPRSVNWRCEEWWDMELLVKNWCRTTGGSVNMTVVVFYQDAYTPIPNAFGVSLVFLNSDDSTFVECRDKIHYNIF